MIGKAIHGKGEWSTSFEEAPLIGHYEFQPEPIAKMLAARFLQLDLPESLRQQIQSRVDLLHKAEQESRRVLDLAERKPYFCSGCPHNTSTVVPEGSRALGGIGCHYMVTWMDRSTDTFTHMGGEGVTWAGQAPFTDTPHVFQNLGDGTYYHSGSLAVRQAAPTRLKRWPSLTRRTRRRCCR